MGWRGGGRRGKRGRGRCGWVFNLSSFYFMRDFEKFYMLTPADLWSALLPFHVIFFSFKFLLQMGME